MKDRVHRAALCAAFFVTAACSSGGGSDPVPPPDPDPGELPANSMEPKATYAAVDGDHLLLRTHFGITTEDRDEIERVGLAKFVDGMLGFPTTGNSAAEQEAFQYLVNGSDPIGLEGKFPSSNDIIEWWLYLMMRSQRPFQERLALFLHDHFAVSSENLGAQERHWMVDHIQTLRRDGIGNFRELVLTMARDSAMLDWLDGLSSVKGEPNENFAREFFELFSVGADNGYVELDIQEASRAFTGYRNRLDTSTNLRYTEFDGERKDIFTKVLFDNVIIRSNGEDRDDYDLVVDVTFERLRVDRWLAEKLLREFVTDDPSERQVRNLAAVVVEHDYEMRPILRTLFLSEAFYAARKSMVRMPVDYGIGFVRSTGLQVSPSVMRNELSSLAQTPSRPPSVFGWPQGPEWLSSEGMVERANLVRRVIGDRTFQTDNGFDVVLPAGAPDAAEVVDHFASLLDVTLDASERDALIEFLDTNIKFDGSTEPDPFDPTESRDVDERVRGLLYVLANHVDAMRR